MSSDKDTEKKQSNEDKLQSINKFQNVVNNFNQNIDNVTDKIINLFNNNSKVDYAFNELNKKFTEVVKEVKSKNENFNKDIIKDINESIDNVSSTIYRNCKINSENNLHSRDNLFSEDKYKSIMVKSSLCFLFYIFIFRRIANVFSPKLFKTMFFITSMNYILFN